MGRPSTAHGCGSPSRSCCLRLSRLLLQGFGVGAAAVGSTISVYAVARLMMNLPAGVLADRYGRKPLLVWGPAVTALGAPNLCFMGFRPACLQPSMT